MHRIFSAFSLVSFAARQTVPVSSSPPSPWCVAHIRRHTEEETIPLLSLSHSAQTQISLQRPSVLLLCTICERRRRCCPREEECPSQSAAAALLHRLLRKRSGIHRRSLTEALSKTHVVARSAAVYFSVRPSKTLPIFSPPSLLFPPPVCPSLSLSVVLPSFGCPSSPSLLGERGDPPAPLSKRRSTVVAGGGIQKAPLLLPSLLP